MLIGTAEIEIFLPGTFSLKEKRFVLQSIKKRIHNTFNVSIAEIDFQDKWQRSSLGIAIVSNDRRHIDTTINKVLQTIYRENRVEVLNQVTEIL